MRCKVPDTRVRYYTTHPGEYVQDLKTGLGTCDAQGVLDGNLDEFLAASILARARKNIADAREESYFVMGKWEDEYLPDYLRKYARRRNAPSDH